MAIEEFNKAQRKFYEADTVLLFNDMQQHEHERVAQTAALLAAHGAKIRDVQPVVHACLDGIAAVDVGKRLRHLAAVGVFDTDEQHALLHGADLGAGGQITPGPQEVAPAQQFSVR